MVESGMEKVATLRHGRIKGMNAAFSVRGDVEWRQRAHVNPICTMRHRASKKRALDDTLYTTSAPFVR
jgi:hypothetical protein